MVMRWFRTAWMAANCSSYRTSRFRAGFHRHGFVVARKECGILSERPPVRTHVRRVVSEHEPQRLTASPEVVERQCEKRPRSRPESLVLYERSEQAAASSSSPTFRSVLASWIVA